MKEQIEEALETEEIASVLADITDFIGNNLLEEDRTEPPYELTPERDRHYTRLIGRDPHMRNHRRQRLRKGILIAAILLAVMAAVHASAIKVVILNYFIDRKPESIDFSESVAPENNTWYAPVSLPSYIPKGYQYQSSCEKEKIVAFIYANPAQPDIRFVIFCDPTAIRINSEGAENIAEIQVNGKQGYRIIRKNEMHLIWGKSPAYLIEGPSSLKEDLLLMAESIVIPPADGLE